ncbi:alpha/beta fold hydrolase [Bosea sp. 2RAB26]|uniref:alpha/beta fold hydrolase n=1 Tax=Bosea sp. 2RAB26 TaxID=3237476 RepID=UPI003F8DAFE8
MFSIEGAQIAARAADGCAINATLMQAGFPGAPRILLIHALAMSWRQWRGVAAAIGQEATVVALDCRGHGASERRRGPYSCEMMAADCIAVLDELGWEEATVVGCSMGGCVAQAVAAGFPQRVSGLVLADTTATYGHQALPAWRERGERALRDGMGTHIGFQLARWFSDGFRASSPEIVEDCLAVFLANDLRCYADSCAMLGETDLRPALKAIRCPTTILVGEFDHATPLAMAEQLAEAIADARLVIIPEAKHFAPVEKPDVVAREILAIAGHPAAAQVN